MTHRNDSHAVGNSPSAEPSCAGPPLSTHAAEPGRRPVLVATIGPASELSIPALLQAGASALRLNTSHLSFDETVAQVLRIRSVDRLVPVVLDLQGAKLRLGAFAPRQIRHSDRVRFEAAVLSPAAIPLPHPEFFAQVQTGDTLSADDGRLRFAVCEYGPDWCVAEAIDAGTLRPRKGINVVEHPIALDELTPADSRLCDFASGLDHVGLACSFMTDGREAAWMRRRAPRARMVGKIERREAIDHIRSIEASVDEIWVCRGDLGAQLGVAGLARWVSAYLPSPQGPPVLMAGQVLEHLTEHKDPTRSEVCHLHDLASRGYAGIVLSDETAIGRYPASAVRAAAELLEATWKRP